MIYLLKINIAIALFYAFYRLFFYKDTFFTWRRTALLCFFGVSALVPLLDIQTWIAAQEPMVAMADLYGAVLTELTITPQAQTMDWHQVMKGGIELVYWIVAALLSARLFVQLASILRLARQCPTAFLFTGFPLRKDLSLSSAGYSSAPTRIAERNYTRY